MYEGRPTFLNCVYLCYRYLTHNTPTSHITHNIYRISTLELNRTSIHRYSGRKVIVLGRFESEHHSNRVKKLSSVNLIVPRIFFSNKKLLPKKL